MTNQSKPASHRYIMAVVFVGVALLLRLFLQPFLGPYSPSSLLVVGITLAAGFGGTGPGLLATALAVLGADYFFLGPHHSFGLPTTASWAVLLLLLTCGVFISLLAQGWPTLRARGRMVLKWLWIDFLFLTGSLKRTKETIAKQRGIVVLTFHRVLPESQYAKTYSSSGMLVKEETFEDMARNLSKHYRIISLGDRKLDWTSEHKRPRVAVTFDDGWVDNIEVAAPIARRYGIPFSMFICSAKVGARMPFWPERVSSLLQLLQARGSTMGNIEESLAIRSGTDNRGGHSRNSHEVLEPLIGFLKQQVYPERDELLQQITAAASVETMPAENGAADSTMTWHQIQLLQEQGVTLGAHSKSHPILTNIPLFEAERELKDGKQEIEEKLGDRCVLFTYPNGDWSWELRNLVSQTGYQFAFTNDVGIWTSDCDPFLIPRINIWQGKVAGPLGGFSRVAFEYEVFWKASRCATPQRGQGGGRPGSRYTTAAARRHADEPRQEQA